MNQLRFLLLQMRNADDPMRGQEVRCFSRALNCAPDQIEVFDLLQRAPGPEDLDRVDVVLLGGSGDYSVPAGGPWLSAAMEAMQRLHRQSKPTFASCWGFQAMARAMGGEVVTDMSRAELGTLPMQLTAEGRRDPVFGPLPNPFRGQAGHQDVVVRLPADAVLLASTDRVTNQAFRFKDKPIYCTQFHPELDRQAFMERLQTYPQYVRRIAGLSVEQFAKHCEDSPETVLILKRFVEQL